jgi:hypothetical protein
MRQGVLVEIRGTLLADTARVGPIYERPLQRLEPTVQCPSLCMGIENVRFHDVRRHLGELARSGRDAAEPVEELVCWAKYEHVLRYAHLAPDHSTEHANMPASWGQPAADYLQALAAQALGLGRDLMQVGLCGT